MGILISQQAFLKNIKPPLLIFASILLHIRFKGKVIPKIGLVLGSHLIHLHFGDALSPQALTYIMPRCASIWFSKMPHKFFHFVRAHLKLSISSIVKDCCGKHHASLTSNINCVKFRKANKPFVPYFSSYNDCLSNLWKKGWNIVKFYTMLQEHLLSTELCCQHIPSSTVALTLK